MALSLASTMPAINMAPRAPAPKMANSEFAYGLPVRAATAAARRCARALCNQRMLLRNCASAQNTACTPSHMRAFTPSAGQHRARRQLRPG